MGEDGVVETHLLLVRHGESVGNAERRFGGHGPTPLTERGHGQARSTAAVLAAQYAPTAIVSSDLQRAMQTAEHIAVATALTVDTTPDLRERGLGDLDGLAFEDAKRRFPEQWEKLIGRDPDWTMTGGGEASRQVFARIGRAIDGICERLAGERVVVVSHGIAIYLAFAHICGLDPFRGDTRVFIRVDNCSITHAVHRTDGVWRLDALNATHHIED
jgi:broad specificity phosphatase PhoE